jgi:Bacterial regulatory proteins, tetR family./Tetracyclin repressor, C-terminal all-alpha domain.
MAGDKSLPRRGRGQRAGLDLARIARVAADFAPRKLTMQAVADRLGVDRSALHYYVTDRPALLELAASYNFAAHLGPTQISDDATWQESCLVLARATRDGVRAAGEAALYIRAWSVSSTEALAPSELVLAKMSDAGFQLDDAARGLYGLSSLAIALTQRQLAAAEHPLLSEAQRALEFDAERRQPLLAAVFKRGELFDDETFDRSILTFITA